MGLMEIELAKLDYRERVAEAERANTRGANTARANTRGANTVRANTARANTRRLRSGASANQAARHGDRRTAGVGHGAGQADHGHREAKIDSPVLSIRLGRFRYRLWFTRYVAV